MSTFGQAGADALDHVTQYEHHLRPVRGVDAEAVVVRVGDDETALVVEAEAGRAALAVVGRLPGEAEVLAVEAVLAVDAADPGATAGASGAVGEDADIGARALSPGAP